MNVSGNESRCLEVVEEEVEPEDENIEQALATSEVDIQSSSFLSNPTKREHMLKKIKILAEESNNLSKQEEELFLNLRKTLTIQLDAILVLIQQEMTKAQETRNDQIQSIVNSMQRRLQEIGTLENDLKNFAHSLQGFIADIGNFNS